MTRYSTGNPGLPPKFRVWCPDRGQTEEDAVIINHLSADSYSDAAEYWAQFHAGFNGDPFSSIECNVEMFSAGDWRNTAIVEVDVRAVPEFTARVTNREPPK